VSVHDARAQDCPQPVGRSPYGPACAVAVADDYADLGSGAALIVIDVSLPDVVQDVAFSSGHAYVADGSAGLRVVDDPKERSDEGSPKGASSDRVTTLCRRPRHDPGARADTLPLSRECQRDAGAEADQILPILNAHRRWRKAGAIMLWWLGGWGA
jgi:hypothetical protein